MYPPQHKPPGRKGCKKSVAWSNTSSDVQIKVGAVLL